MKSKLIEIKDISIKDSKDSEIILIDTSKYIYFDTGKYNIRNISKLKSFINNFKNMKKVYFYIVGHTDSIGTDKYNQLLSELRAKEVYNIFIESGFNKSKVDYIGYGEEQPIATNKTQLGRAKNRRVELIITNKKDLAEYFLHNRIININYLNNHNNVNPGKVEISQKGLTKNKTNQEIKILELKLKTPKRTSFDIHIDKRKHFINFSKY